MAAVGRLPRPSPTVNVKLSGCRCCFRPKTGLILWPKEPLMPVTNPRSGTRIDEIGDGIYRIHTPVGPAPGTFSFNQFLIADEEPLLYHTGPRQMFGLVREAVATVLPVEKLRYFGFSHFENDESGCLNEWLAVS